MTIAKEVLRLALSHTSSPEEATRYTDLLGVDALNCRPRVAFPSEWVVAKQNGPAKIAVFAVEYCDDSKILADIEAKAKRITVRQALAANPALSDATKDRMRTRAMAESDYEIVRILNRNVPPAPEVTSLERFEAFWLEKDFSPSAVQRLDRYIDDKISTEMADQLFDAILAAGETWVVAFMLEQRYVGHARVSNLINRTSHTHMSALEALSPSQRRDVLTEFLHDISITRSYRSSANVDVELLSMMIGIVPDEFVAKHFASVTPSRGWLAPESIDLVIDSTGVWRKVVAGHSLSAEQFVRFVKTMSSDELKLAIDLLDLVSDLAAPGLRDTVDELAAALGDTVLDARKVDMFLNFVHDSQDPLVQVLLDHATLDARSSYVCGQWRNRAARTMIIPSIDQMKAIVPDLAVEVRSNVSSYVSTFRSSDLSREYRYELLEEAPGLARLAVSRYLDADEAQYVYDRLMASAASSDLALTQFSENTSASLRRLCQVIANLSALESAQ